MIVTRSSLQLMAYVSSEHEKSWDVHNGLIMFIAFLSVHVTFVCWFCWISKEMIVFLAQYYVPKVSVVVNYCFDQ